MKAVEKYLYGIIGRKQDIDTNRLTAEIESLRLRGHRDFVFYVNSEGGEVSQGSSLFNYFDRTDINVTWVVDGLAASMMALLLTNPKHRVKAARHAKFMYHRVWGATAGNSEELRSYADMLDTFETSLIAMMAKRMRSDEDSVRARFFSGADCWLSAPEALELGLADEIIEEDVSVSPEEPDDFERLSLREIYNFYNKQIMNSRKMGKETSIDIGALALSLGLEPGDEEQVSAQMHSIVAQNRSLTESLAAEKTKREQLESRLQDFEKAKAASLVDGAIALRKITPAERDSYVTLAEKDYASMEKILNGMHGVTPVKDQLNVGGIAAKYEGKSWDELDRSGLLPGLKSEAPELYNRLYDEKFKLRTKS
jgi:ATP-dependent protease ClpP protease subunit